MVDTELFGEFGFIFFVAFKLTIIYNLITDLSLGHDFQKMSKELTSKNIFKDTFFFSFILSAIGLSFISSVVMTDMITMGCQFLGGLKEIPFLRNR